MDSCGMADQLHSRFIIIESSSKIQRTLSISCKLKYVESIVRKLCCIRFLSADISVRTEHALE
jgi:hypothetical protein